MASVAVLSLRSNPATARASELLGVGRDSASRQQADRVNALLSPESREALRDLALITARRQERDATTQAVGGLAAGAAITNIVSRPGRAVQAAIVARGLAELITRPGVRRWLSNTRRKKMSPGRQAQTTALAPSLMDVVGGAMSENADVQAAMDWLDSGFGQASEFSQD